MSVAPVASARDPSFDGIRADLPQAFHVPGRIYASEEVLEMEKERIFLRSWNLACRAEEIANPGDYLTLDIGGEPVIVSRTREGTVAAVINACAHRGVELATGRGNTRRFVCPYHAWTYELDGRIVGASFAKASGRDVSDRSLQPLRVAEWQGWVFVNPDRDAEPFEEFIRSWESGLWFYQAGQCRLAFTVELEFNCNWKLLTENVSDFYHASTVHAASFGKQFNFGDGSLPLQFIDRGGWIGQFDATRRANFGARFPDLPWLQGREDFAAGKAAIFPNVNIFANRESIRTSVFRPLSAGRTKAIWWFLLPEAVLNDPAAQEGIAFYREQIVQITQEDQAVVESLQRAASSRFYRPGPLVNLEAAVRHMVNCYLDVMKF